MSFSSINTIKHNLEALKLVFKLGNDIPTIDEINILKKYSGFGGIKEILLDYSNPDIWSKSSLPLLPYVQELYELLDNSISDSSLKGVAIKELRNSILSSFYTPTEVCKAISKSIANLNLPIRTVLEPSCGIGSILDELKSVLDKKTIYTGYEKDYLTGKIVSAIHNRNNTFIKTEPFEKSDKYDFYDLVISNIPFGDVKIFDPAFSKKDNLSKISQRNIVDYFFMKSLASAKDKGIVVILTSSAFSNTLSHEPFRKALLEKSNLLSAIRLPNNLFKENANTEVQTDLIIVQKDNHKQSLTLDEQSYILTNMRKDIPFNKYFTQSSNIIFTDGKIKGNQYGKEEYYISHKGGVQQIAKQLNSLLNERLEKNLKQLIPTEDKLLKTIYPSLFINESPKKPVKTKNNRNDGFVGDLFSSINLEDIIIPEDSIIVEKAIEDTLLLKKDSTNLLIGQLINENNSPYRITNIEGDTLALDRIRDKEEMMLLYIDLRDQYLLLEKLDTTYKNSDNREARTQLNVLYDKFIRSYSFLNNNSIDDIYFNTIKLIELKDNNEIKKSDIFYKNIYQSSEIRTIQDAFLRCLNEKGNFDIDYIKDLIDVTDTAILSELEGKILFNPDTETIDLKERVLFGNIYELSNNLERYIQNNPQNIFAQKSLEIVKKQYPDIVTYNMLDFNLGERWLPLFIYEDFSKSIFGKSISIKYQKGFEQIGNNDQFICQDNFTKDEKELYSIHDANGKLKMNGVKIFEYALQDIIPKFTKDKIDEEGQIVLDDLGKPVKVPDPYCIKKAILNISQIRDRFVDFMRTNISDELKHELEKEYNFLYNCYPKIEFNGDHLNFADANLKSLGIDYIRPAQKSAIWQQLILGGGIIDHEVGLGKTLTLCLTAHEGKKTGIWNKPIIVCMKAVIEDIVKTYVSLYPNDKILYLSSFGKKEKEEQLFKIKNNDYDAIFLTKESLSKIPVDEDIQYEIVQDELRALTDSYYAMSSDIDIKIAKRMEANIQNLGVKLEELMDRINNRTSASLPYFSELGIDHILVDESHNFKNLKFSTRHSNVSGIGNVVGSERSTTLLTFIRSLQYKKNKDFCVSFYSGTMISNSLSELYLLFKYMIPKVLEKAELLSFDSWASVFAKKTIEYEMSITDDIIQKERFRTFIKLPELAQLYRMITNYKTCADAGIERPIAKERSVVVLPNEYQTQYMEDIKDFVTSKDASNIATSLAEQSKFERGGALTACTLSGKVALDIRLIDQFSDLEIDGNTKCKECAREVLAIYKKTNDFKGTQIIFSDTGVPNNEKSFTIYDQLKKDLISLGIPEKEIAFIHDFKNDQQIKQFEEKVRNGTIRIAIGSTDKLGTGKNVQERVSAIHHLDITWKPSIHEQRNGRGIRQGNKFNKEVDIIYYTTKNTLDSYKLSINSDKSNFIKQIKLASTNNRIADEGFDEQMNFNQFLMAIVPEGNKLLLEEKTLVKDISSLRVEKEMFNEEKKKICNEDNIRKVNRSIESNTNTLKTLKADLNKYESFKDPLVFHNKLELNNFEKINKTELTKVDGENYIETAYKIRLGKYLQESIEIAKENDQDKFVIGKLNDFQISVIKNESVSFSSFAFKEFNLTVESSDLSIKYTHFGGKLAQNPSAAGSYLENCFKPIAKLVDNALYNIEVKQAELNRINSLSNYDWNKDHLLNEKIERLQQVKKELTVINETNIENELSSNIDELKRKGRKL